jgi:hypothetical protein
MQARIEDVGRLGELDAGHPHHRGGGDEDDDEKSERQRVHGPITRPAAVVRVPLARGSARA